jgi:hypothetical protein
MQKEQEETEKFQTATTGEGTSRPTHHFGKDSVTEQCPQTNSGFPTESDKHTGSDGQERERRWFWHHGDVAELQKVNLS